LLFVFRSDCPVCATQRSDWGKLGVIARDHGVRTLAVTPESLSPPVVSYFAGAPFEVHQIAEPMQLVSELGVRMVPTTMMIGPDRRILFRGAGLLSPETLEVLRARLRAEGE
jgi:hypothetical protein